MLKQIIQRSLLASFLLCCAFTAGAERYTVPLLVPAGATGDPQGFVRILNDTQATATIAIHAIDDAGVRTGPATVVVNALSAVELSATELQSGNVAKGLSTGFGSLGGDVRLVLDSDAPIVPSAYVRGADGALAAMHEAVLEAAGAGGESYRYDVALFHSASNVSQPSRLRLINPGDTPAQVTIEARDDTGAAATGGAVQLTLPPQGARTLTALQLEAGDAVAFSGRLGAGVGDWRLAVTADRPIEVVNVTVSTDGDWRNLSGTAVSGWAPVDHTAFVARFLKRPIVSRDGQYRNEFQVLESNRFLHRYMEDGMEVRQESRFEYERTGRDAGLLRLDYDVGVNCEARLYFGSRHSGWYAFACVDSGNKVDVWNGGAWLSLEAGAAPLDLGPPLDDSVHAAGTAIDPLTLPAAGGGEGELTYSLSPEVPGLSFDPETRRLSGTPTEAGTWTMTYRVRDASGDTDWRYFNIAVAAPGSGGETTHGVGDTLSELPAASWTPDVISGGSFSMSGDSATVRLDEGGYIEEGESRYTCQGSGGCVIENRSVTAGTIIQTARGTAPGDSGAGTGAPSSFDLHADNSWPNGIAHANGRFYVLDAFDDKVYAYTGTGQRDATADFDLDEGNSDARGIAHANARFHVVDGSGKKAYAYAETGARDASADFDLDEDNLDPGGIAHANGRFHVVDFSEEKVFAYTETGGRDASADFDLDEENSWPSGIAHANGRFHVVDVSEEKVFAYTDTGGRDASADFDLHNDSFLPAGIAVANGRFYVVDNSGADSRVYVYGGTDPGGGDTGSDDHGDDLASATPVGAGSDTEAVLTAGDVDYFVVEVSAAGTLEVYTSGDVDTLGRLEDFTGTEVDDDDDGGADRNFRIAAEVSSGTYYVRVSGFSSGSAGDYTLHVRFSESTATTDPPAGSGTAEYFDLGDFAVALDIAYANGRFHVLDAVGGTVYAYTAAGDRDAAADFDLDEDNDEATGIVHADGRFHVVDSSDDKVYAYTVSGARDAAADFDLDDDNDEATGIAHADGRFHVVDWWNEKVYAYMATGDRDAAADFDLDGSNVDPEGIVHVDGRFHVVDASVDRVYAYTASGVRDTSADFNLDAENGDATGIAHGNGGFHVVDWSDDKVYAYTDSGERDTAADFDLGAENVSARGIVHADGRFHLVNLSDHRVYAYTDSGDRDTSADFGLDVDNGSPEGIAHANGRFHVVDWWDGKVYAYTASGDRDAAADFVLDNDNGHATGIAHADGRFFVVDSSDNKVYAYADSGDRDASADFDLDGGNDDARGIAHANGRFHVVDWWNEKVYAYTELGERDAAADFDLDGHNIVPEGIAFANGRLHVVDAGVDRVYSYPVQSDDYTPLTGLRVSAGRIQYGFFSTGGCISLTNFTLNGVTYTVHDSKWQRRSAAGSPWEDVAGTERQGEVCAYTPTSAGEYRLVAEVTIGDTRGRYSSENTIVVD